MSGIEVTEIRLRSRPGVVEFKCEPSECAHAWEFHAWDESEAYCPDCGSFAKAVNDPERRRGGSARTDARPGRSRSRTRKAL